MWYVCLFRGQNGHIFEKYTGAESSVDRKSVKNYIDLPGQKNYTNFFCQAKKFGRNFFRNFGNSHCNYNGESVGWKGYAKFSQNSSNFTIFDKNAKMKEQPKGSSENRFSSKKGCVSSELWPF